MINYDRHPPPIQSVLRNKGVVMTNKITSENDAVFQDAIQGLQNGDFSRLEPLFAYDHPESKHCQVIEWYEEGFFEEGEAFELLEEVLTCACFLGYVDVAAYFLDVVGISPYGGGDKTGMDALHWAVNRGQLETTMLLLQHYDDIESTSRFGGTVIETAIWSSINEPKQNHIQIIQALIDEGAEIDHIEIPTGNADVDKMLKTALNRD